MDELLVGNALEEIACRAVVDDDAFARVPLGATPDDIAKCTVAQDVLKARCIGDRTRSASASSTVAASSGTDDGRQG